MSILVKVFAIRVYSSIHNNGFNQSEALMLLAFIICFILLLPSVLCQYILGYFCTVSCELLSHNTSVLPQNSSVPSFFAYSPVKFLSESYWYASQTSSSVRDILFASI
ncbi:hypothetical protein KFK09_008618 [Dendrobium nobile]|uniref:Uncharacterized protein n=1 Tax=Dendrobium nobile TaxID=94219 RepID=A0A8T3BLL4_DENNO|nr:hypothetical protein KFK09_008618 [Dendrobium nobile]